MRRERKSAHPAAKSRRDFLRTVGIGATATAAAAGPLAGAAQADTESNDEKRKSRYRESEHVKTYYRVNRYPT
jgi:anaerobic selenocysteine-containing dehydrogenase